MRCLRCGGCGAFGHGCDGHSIHILVYSLTVVLSLLSPRSATPPDVFTLGKQFVHSALTRPTTSPILLPTLNHIYVGADVLFDQFANWNSTDIGRINEQTKAIMPAGNVFQFTSFKGAAIHSLNKVPNADV
ncbi:hypothetical protein BU23DRAFT_59291 [Bimuria novae-zelandiae CBS 107.79]|uniref:Uncharacterized protein n=1 Tax=Bimuria novae-zelandiae CBS 107.79 TaxID=1447943 RepID=A0A6A5VHX1_9PLEO|nr:hypothetical protein BU23DRAFT_59291 [Bimuria novae-zelandiae CBS 107.79]